MDSTAAQSSSLLTANMPVAALPVLLANSSLMQYASGFLMAPPPGFFASAPIPSLRCSFPLTMAAIPSSAPIVSVLPGLPSTASIVPNTYFHGAMVVPLSNTHQVISLKLTTNNYLYWKMQMKPYLLGQGVYAFIDGSYHCPALYVIATDITAPGINPLFLLWKQQDQLIMSELLSSLSTEILHLVVDCDISYSIWRTLEKSFTSPSHSTLCSYMVPFRIYAREMIQLALICSELRSSLMSWLLLVGLSP